jgi:hypothetical protein
MQWRGAPQSESCVQARPRLAAPDEPPLPPTPVDTTVLCPIDDDADDAPPLPLPVAIPDLLLALHAQSPVRVNTEPSKTSCVRREVIACLRRAGVALP